MVTWRAFRALVRIGWRESLEYRAESLIWMLTGALPLFIMAVWISAAGSGAIRGYTAAGFAGYYVASLAVRQFTAAWIVWDMDEDMRQGRLSFHLLRPIDPIWHYFVRGMQSKQMRLPPLLAALVVVALVVPGVRYEGTPLVLAVFAASLGLGYVLSFLLTYLVGIAGFWTTSTLSIYQWFFLLSSFFSGYLLPISLMPGTLGKLAAVLPFRWTVAFPIDVLSGRATGTALLGGLALQCAWCAGCWLVVRLAWWQGLRRYAAVGG